MASDPTAGGAPADMPVETPDSTLDIPAKPESAAEWQRLVEQLQAEKAGLQDKQLRALAEAQGLAFRHVASSAWVHGDPQLLRRVLQNFLANAVRYTARGSVLLGVRREGGGVRIEVHDTGPGIAASQQRAIFEEFRRGEGVVGQGLGLGLAIADRIARLIEAPLRLRSRLGRGTVFSLSLPTIPAPHQDTTPVSGGLEGLRILIVDNDPQALAALRGLLAAWGCRVDAFADGAGAEALLAAGAEPALWLFDYHLGDSRDDGDTGVALQARLAQRFGARPTLILSADDSGDVRRVTLEHGLGLLPKPVKALALKSMLRRLLAARVA